MIIAGVGKVSRNSRKCNTSKPECVEELRKAPGEEFAANRGDVNPGLSRVHTSLTDAGEEREIWMFEVVLDRARDCYVVVVGCAVDKRSEESKLSQVTSLRVFLFVWNADCI